MEISNWSVATTKRSKLLRNVRCIRNVRLWSLTKLRAFSVDTLYYWSTHTCPFACFHTLDKRSRVTLAVSSKSLDYAFLVATAFIVVLVDCSHESRWGTYCLHRTRCVFIDLGKTLEGACLGKACSRFDSHHFWTHTWHRLWRRHHQ